MSAKSSPEPSWWAPVWRGLVVDPHAKHRQVIGNALWVYVYLIVHADRATGVLRRKLNTIAKDMDVTSRIIQYGISKLRRGGYITTTNSGRFLEIRINKWKPVGNGRQQRLSKP